MTKPVMTASWNESCGSDRRSPPHSLSVRRRRPQARSPPTSGPTRRSRSRADPSTGRASASRVCGPRDCVFVFATLMSSGTPSSFGSWPSAATARTFTSVSGSCSIARVIVSAACLLARCASQNSASPRTSGLRARTRRLDQHRHDVGLAALRDREDGVLADALAGIFAHQAAHGFESGAATRAREPERRAAPHVIRLRRLQQLLQHAIRGRIAMKRDPRHDRIRRRLPIRRSPSATSSPAIRAARGCRTPSRR